MSSNLRESVQESKLSTPMLPRHESRSHVVLTLLCCLLPLAALGATLVFHVPTALTALVALALLIPIARWLVADAAGESDRSANVPGKPSSKR